MSNLKYIRDNFLERFRKLADNEGISILEEWFPPPFPEDAVVANWISEPLKKVMRIQEDDDGGDDGFGGFVAQAGLDYEYDDLCLIAVCSHEKVREIFELYQLWFIKDISPKEMRKILASYIQLLNPEMSEILVSYLQCLNQQSEIRHP